MNYVIQLLVSPWATLVSLAIGVLGLVAGYVFYRRSLQRKEAYWTVRNNTLVEDHTSTLADLTVSFRGEDVRDLSVARILFWNGGTATIDRVDLVQADPVRVVALEDRRILDVSVLASNNSASEITTSIVDDGRAAQLGFAYLDPGQGCVLQIVHTGTDDKHLRLAGTIKSAGVPKRRVVRTVEFLPLPTSEQFDKRLRPHYKRWAMAGLTLVLAMMSIVAAYTSFYELAGATKPRAVRGVSQTDRVMPVVLGTVMAFYALFFVFNTARILRSKPPRGLEAYEID